MKKFKFKLDPLLNYRKYQERIAQQKTAKAHLEVKTCEEQIINLDQMKHLNAQNIETIVSKGVSASVFRQYHQYSQSLEGSIKEEKIRKIHLEKILQEKLLELKKKTIDKKAMEIYRKKLRAQYTQEAAADEQKNQDEISSLKTARTISNETL
ncbi:MAG: flagellar export protein FliJ [Proteobacteria bacterium]|nr:flagellar export protein FliJ [Pseudomonadota bacterium]MBU1388960.1 flagellar export protein FliJ [Pseudomonadota bacterium]MBU1543512.1 flagellar export protein FliJ [Pseudomonadota bacterium]MBU2480829.1 flagellar export protein FliJ [Pseudomonadota bacterium]